MQTLCNCDIVTVVSPYIFVISIKPLFFLILFLHDSIAIYNNGPLQGQISTLFLEKMKPLIVSEISNFIASILLIWLFSCC